MYSQSKIVTKHPKTLPDIKPIAADHFALGNKVGWIQILHENNDDEIVLHTRHVILDSDNIVQEPLFYCQVMEIVIWKRFWDVTDFLMKADNQFEDWGV